MRFFLSNMCLCEYITLYINTHLGSKVYTTNIKYLGFKNLFIEIILRSLGLKLLPITDDDVVL